MQRIRITTIDEELLVSQLVQGNTLVYPTETCYGLGCDATNQEAVDRIFTIKQRPTDKSVLMIVPDMAMAQQYVVWNEQINKLAQTYWPGPLTIVAEARADMGLARGVIARDGTVAFRVSSHPLVIALSTALDRPLVSTSANISGVESPYTIASVERMFMNQPIQPDIVIDAGDLPEQSPSTIVRVLNGVVTVLRQGGIILESSM